MKSLNSEIEILRLVLKQFLGEQCPAAIREFLSREAIDWIKVRDLLDYHEVGAVFYAVLKNDIALLPQGISSLLSNTFYHTLKDNWLKLRQFQRIHQAFEKEGVRMLGFKGVALLAQFYTHLPIRPMADIDILLGEEDYEKGIKILKEIGFEKKLLGLKESYWRQKQCHLIFVERNGGKVGIVLEAHWAMDFRRNGKLILKESWQKTRSMNTEFGRINVLSPEDTLFSLALHQRRFGKMFCLKYILDSAFILKKCGKEFDWDYFLSSCEKYGLSSCIGFFLLQGKLFMDSALFDCGLERISLSATKRAIMKSFISNSVFSLRLSKKIKENYLKCHFLLYDTYAEPVKYIITIPIEQFAKYYGFIPYSKKTSLLYRLRYIYMPLTCLCRVLENILNGNPGVKQHFASS